MTCTTIVGARPQFIKAAPVSRALAARGIEERLIHTGQHYDFEMSEVFFRELQIPTPRYSLGLGGGMHGAMTGQMLAEIERILIDDRPDVVLVYGDTNSTLAGALAASKLQIPVCHVEAGLRSYNRLMPEEINRVLTDHLSEKLLCSSPVGVENLAKEGIVEGVEVVGDVMADASKLAQEITAGALPGGLAEVEPGLLDEDFILLTLHRAENTDDAERLRQLMDQINALEQPILFPVHPRTRSALKRVGVTPAPHVVQLDPVGYLEMAYLLGRAALVMTDSGGLQKEAYWARVPCVTLRTETEWVETVDCGWNVVFGRGERPLPDCIARLAHRPEWTPLYGDGCAAERIAASLGG